MDSTYHYDFDEHSGRYLILRGRRVLGFAPNETQAKASVMRLISARLQRLVGGHSPDQRLRRFA